MKKFLKWAGIIIGSLAVILFLAFKVLQAQTKKHSPEDTVAYIQGDMDLSVYYNRPSVKGREIFGVRESEKERRIDVGKIKKRQRHHSTTSALTK